METVEVRLGVLWIDSAHVEQFLREILQDESISVTHFGGNEWTVHGGRRSGDLATSTWGTEEVCAENIAQSLLRGMPLTAGESAVRGRMASVDAEAADAVEEKARQLNERFASWVWEDSERSSTLARRYSSIFDNVQTPDYGTVELQLPPIPSGKSAPQVVTHATERLRSETMFLHQVDGESPKLQGDRAARFEAAREAARTSAIDFPDKFTSGLRVMFQEAAAAAALRRSDSAHPINRGARR